MNMSTINTLRLNNLSLEKKKRIKALNKDIHSMEKTLIDMKSDSKIFKMKRKSINPQDLEKEIANANHQKLKLCFPDRETLYEFAIEEVCGDVGLYVMKKYGLVETCAFTEFGKLYAI